MKDDKDYWNNSANVWNERILNVGGTIQKQLDFSSMPKGVYTLKLNSENGFGVKKLVLH